MHVIKKSCIEFYRNFFDSLYTNDPIEYVYNDNNIPLRILSFIWFFSKYLSSINKYTTLIGYDFTERE